MRSSYRAGEGDQQPHQEATSEGKTEFIAGRPLPAIPFPPMRVAIPAFPPPFGPHASPPPPFIPPVMTLIPNFSYIKHDQPYWTPPIRDDTYGVVRTNNTILLLLSQVRGGGSIFSHDNPTDLDECSLIAVLQSAERPVRTPRSHSSFTPSIIDD
ncbi:hypothetical protein NLI96_g11421 [Meripilus lineatus]|uniref:Uncharacterized protein n=1 Tax=Meripilus lineatus TaxID=2056292 RepID=A0AAD5UVY3_9APHY|nr:hypothetical protein NLI96_g11421 [Physisporinus lineatus]